MKKIKLIGFIVMILVTIVVSQLCGITISTKNGGVLLLPVLYFCLVYVVPHMVSDYISEWKEIINDGEVCFTKGAYLDKCIEEAIGEKPEELITTLEGEEIETD